MSCFSLYLAHAICDLIVYNPTNSSWVISAHSIKLYSLTPRVFLEYWSMRREIAVFVDIIARPISGKLSVKVAPIIPDTKDRRAENQKKIKRTGI